MLIFACDAKNAPGKVAVSSALLKIFNSKPAQMPFSTILGQSQRKVSQLYSLKKVIAAPGFSAKIRKKAWNTRETTLLMLHKTCLKVCNQLHDDCIYIENGPRKSKRISSIRVHLHTTAVATPRLLRQIYFWQLFHS